MSHDHLYAHIVPARSHNDAHQTIAKPLGKYTDCDGEHCD